MTARKIRLVLQPEGSGLCGQSCVAMVAGISLQRAIMAVGHESTRGTTTREIVEALVAVNINCSGRLRRVSRSRPALPARAIVAIHRPPSEKRNGRWHWMLTWDGQMYDPGGCWPDSYKDWRITSYLEIL